MIAKLLNINLWKPTFYFDYDEMLTGFSTAGDKTPVLPPVLWAALLDMKRCITRGNHFGE